MDTGDFFSSMGDGVFKGRADNAFTGFFVMSLIGVNRIFIHLIFDAIYKSSVFSRKVDDVDVREGRRYGRIRFCRTDIGIEIVFIAQGDV